MKKKTLFTIIDILLVAIIGLIFGFSCADHIFSTNAGIVSFTGLLVTLFIPTIIYLFYEKLNPANTIISTLFVLGELVANIVFIVKPTFGLTNFAITQGVIIGVYLIALLSIIAFYKVDKIEE